MSNPIAAQVNNRLARAIECSGLQAHNAFSNHSEVYADYQAAVIATRERYGKNSPEHVSASNALALFSRRYNESLAASPNQVKPWQILHNLALLARTPEPELIRKDSETDAHIMSQVERLHSMFGIQCKVVSRQLSIPKNISKVLDKMEAA